MHAARDIHEHTKYRDVTGLATSIPSRKGRSFYVTMLLRAVEPIWTVQVF